jgi:hypothetical protein
MQLAAKLCAEAKDGQILISSHIARAVEAAAILENLGNLELRPVAAFNVVQSTGAPDARPNLTVAGGRGLILNDARSQSHPVEPIPAPTGHAPGAAPRAAD